MTTLTISHELKFSKVKNQSIDEFCTNSTKYYYIWQANVFLSTN